MKVFRRLSQMKLLLGPKPLPALTTEVAEVGHHTGAVEHAGDVFLRVQPGKLSAAAQLRLYSLRLKLYFYK